MTVAILHLTDIHIAHKDDHILGRSEAIAASLRPYLPGAESVILLLSGDIAQSGQLHEYELAEMFLYQITDFIAKETDVPVDVICAPGNHDCDFSGDQDVRNAVLAAAAQKGVTPGLIGNAVSVQEAFFDFQKRVSTGTETVASDVLWATHRVEVGGRVMVIDVLNASWMSTRYEQPGGLIFPFERYKAERDLASDLRITTLHHPFNWYSQSNHHQFRGYINGLADFVFTGHEHQSAGREVDDAEYGVCHYVEGSVLQSRTDDALSGFNIVLIDLKASAYRYIPLQLEKGKYLPTSLNDSWEKFRSVEKKSANAFPFTDSFRRVLDDPGAALGHPSGANVHLKDIFVYPDLDSRTESASARVRGRAVQKFRSRNLCDIKSIEQDVLLEGSESSGKTRLLYALLDSYHEAGLLPLLVRGREIKKFASDDMDKVVRQAITAQYGPGKVEDYLQSPKAQRVLLVDDLDLSPVKGNFRVAAIDALKAYFFRAVITVGENFEIAEFVEGSSESGASSARQYKQYRISPFGYERRAELVRKWVGIGKDPTQTVNEGLKVYDDAQSLIEGSRLQHIAPSVPIYVLSLLQAASSGMSKELHNSSFAHYYHMLIVGALERGGVKAEDMNAFISACTHLSWFVQRHGDEQRISLQQFEEFVDTYSREWTRTDANELLKVLTATRLLDHDGDAVAFAYPYAYYYFLGRYASVYIRDDEVGVYLGHCVSNLYVRECANTLLFLAHHSGHSEVLLQLVASIRSHFPDRTPMTLSREDVAGVSNLLSAAPRITFKARAPVAFRDEIARQQDEEEAGDGLVDRPSEERSLFNVLVSLTKSVEIAGTLLTHQFPNYRNIDKDEAVREVFNGALRAIRELYSYFSEDAEGLVKVLTVQLSKRSDMSREKAEHQARLAIGLLLRAITATFLAMAASAVKSPVLSAHVAMVMGSEPTFAYRLIRLAQHLQTPQRLPRVEVEKLMKEEGTNPCVAGPLQLLVLQRLYMYETDHDDRDWAISTLQLGRIEPNIPGTESRWRQLPKA
jgi:hypothetical protein